MDTQVLLPCVVYAPDLDLHSEGCHDVTVAGMHDFQNPVTFQKFPKSTLLVQTRISLRTEEINWPILRFDLKEKNQ